MMPPLPPPVGAPPVPGAEDGLFMHVNALKQAPPPSRKIISFLDAELGLTQNPVLLPSRHCASGTGTHVQVMSVAPVMGAPASAQAGGPRGAALASLVVPLSWPASVSDVLLELELPQA